MSGADDAKSSSPTNHKSPGDLKTSQRVAANITMYRMNNKPINCDPDEIGADVCNRGGSPTNIMMCHSVLAPSFLKDGFDPEKPSIGVCRSYHNDPEKKEELIQWNRKFSDGDDRYPAIFPAKMDKGSLACTHVATTSRMFKQGMTTQDGLCCIVPPDDTHLQDLIRVGHLWWVLRSDCPDDVASEISIWYNSSNNSSQVSHEMEHIKHIQRVCRKEMQTSNALVISTVMSKTMNALRVKSAGQTLLHLVKYVILQGCTDMIDMLCMFHASEVNPNELTVPPCIFGEVAALPKYHLNLKLDIITMAYNDKAKIEKPRPQPDIAEFVKTADVKSLSSRPEEMALIDKHMQTIRLEAQKQLESFIAPCRAAKIVRELSHQILRVALSKQVSDSFNPKVKGGTMDQEKIDTITIAWKQWVQKTVQPPRDSKWVFVEHVVTKVDGITWDFGNAPSVYIHGGNM